MFKLCGVALVLSFVLVFSAFLGVIYQVIPTDPTRAAIGGFVFLMTLGTSPVWWAWLRGTHI